MACLVLIFVLSSMPQDSLVIIPIPFFDKFVHAVEYGVLSFLLARGFKNSNPELTRSQLILLAWLLATLYGATDELHQHFVVTRSASYADLFFDCIGAFAGSIIYKKRL